MSHLRLTQSRIQNRVNLLEDNFIALRPEWEPKGNSLNQNVSEIKTVAHTQTNKQTNKPININK